MRIISGKWKGKRLSAPKNLPTRPTTDFAKEALFNILNHNYFLGEVSVLDLYAGIGGITFEFASRGAVRVQSVEKFGKCVTFIQETAEALQLDQIEVIRQDVFQFLSKDFHKKFDLVFADPPFELPIEDYNKLIDIIIDREFLENGGTFILEHPKDHSFSEHRNYSDHKKYGNVHFTFFEKEDNSEEE